MSKKIFAIVLAALMLVSVLAGCGGSKTEAPAAQSAPSNAQTTEAQPAATDDRGTFVFGDYVGSVDPAASAYSWVGIRVGVMEPLFKLDDSLSVQKNLVEDYSVSDDGLTWTIVLRDGVRFSNGNPMDGEAVKASLERISEKQARADGEMQIASIEADGNTVKVTTRDPNPVLPNCLCDPYSCIVDVKSLNADGEATIGTGPFKLVEYVENERMELDANDDYWAGKPASKHVTIRAISDLDASSLALQKGELDACYGLSYDARDLFDGVKGYKISQAATARVYKIYFNHEHEFTGDPNFRKAVVMATDKASYAQVLINGAGTPTKATFPESVAFGKDAPMTNVPDFDLAGAKKLLEDSGYTYKDGLLYKGDKPVTLDIITYSRTGLPQSSQALQSALKEIGIVAELEQISNADERGAAGTFDLSVYAEVTLPTGDPFSYMKNSYGTGGVQNFGRISIPEVDDLLVKLSAEFDPAKRAELASQIDQIVLSENHICNMFHLNMYMAMKDTVEGLTQSPVDYYHITYQTCVK